MKIPKISVDTIKNPSSISIMSLITEFDCTDNSLSVRASVCVCVCVCNVINRISL